MAPKAKAKGKKKAVGKSKRVAGAQGGDSLFPYVVGGLLAIACLTLAVKYTGPDKGSRGPASAATMGAGMPVGSDFVK